MNRAKQLKEALESCLRCELPHDTEFVIIDNASTDNTEVVVTELLNRHPFTYCYKKMPENIGAGGGRNLAFELASGKYIYGLDDDAAISEQKDFFMRAIDLLESNDKVATITTQIYDTAWECNRVCHSKPVHSSQLEQMYMFCAGSHFIRKECFNMAPYWPSIYGYEELPPSLIAFDMNRLNVFIPDLLVIHKPIFNKWNFNDDNNIIYLLKELAMPYAIKSMMFPKVFAPLLYVMFRLRCLKHIKRDKSLFERCLQMVSDVKQAYPISKKMSFTSCVKLLFTFGFRSF